MLLPPDTELGPTLLDRARHAIEHELGLKDASPADDPRLASRGATFVTLRLAGELRGCLGSVRPQRALGHDVVVNAIGAATRDPRFMPVATQELNDIRVEVSLLSEPQFLEFADEDGLLRQLRPGVDGLMLFGGCRSATFLPQVWEQLSDPRDFLDALLRKGGIRSMQSVVAATYTVRKWQE
jgi:AmmeMemoRadiSam system protein A